MKSNVKPSTFKATRKPAPLDAPKPFIGEPADEFIQDPGTGSTLEMRVYRALLKAGWQKDSIGVQVDLFGGRKQKGGQVIDFVLYTPTPIPIRVQGEYWHKDSGQEILEAADIKRKYKVDPVDFYGKRCKTDEETFQEVIRLIGRGS